MGTRINALLHHDLIDFRDRESVLARLAPTVAAALAAREYWRSVDPQDLADDLTVWQPDPVNPRLPGRHHFTGPGSLFLTVTATAAHLRTGGRWRGFLSIEPLRRVHLTAFRHIAGCLGSRRMALCADSDEVNDLFWDGGTQADCVALLEQMWGPPQPNVEEIDPQIEAEAERTVPLVWFLV